jgi:uncharacterized beta-barrel protein YwiB (DUF1934 family)
MLQENQTACGLGVPPELNILFDEASASQKERIVHEYCLLSGAREVVLPRSGSVQFNVRFFRTQDWTLGSVQRNY